jgi:hypothetical protein
MLLNAHIETGVTNETWLSALTKNKFTGTSALRFNLTPNNNIGNNPSNNGLAHIIKAKCYDASDNLIGYVAFQYVFYVNTRTVYAVYILRDANEYGYIDTTHALNCESYNSADIFELAVNTATKEWSVSKVGVGVANGSVLLGLMPTNTAYVKYETVFFCGYSISATAEIDVISIT